MKRIFKAMIEISVSQEEMDAYAKINKLEDHVSQQPSYSVYDMIRGYNSNLEIMYLEEIFEHMTLSDLQVLAKQMEKHDSD